MKSCGEQINFSCRKISDWDWPLVFPFETGREVGCSKDVVGVVQVTCLKRNKMYSSIGRSSQILYLQLVLWFCFVIPIFEPNPKDSLVLPKFWNSGRKTHCFEFLFFLFLISNVLLFLIFFFQRRSQWSSSKK